MDTTLIILIALIFDLVLCYIIANSWEKRGLSYRSGFWISFFFTPLIGILVGLMQNGHINSPTKKCPACAELIKKEALICHFCGKKFEPSKSIVEQKGIELTVDNYLNAVRDNNKELVELFINDGIDINSCDKYGITALMLAVEKEYIDIVQILIANKADVNIKTKAGWTALKSAKGKSEIMDLLRNAEAS